MSFIDVPGRDYIEGYLGVYELTRTSLLQDVFVWSYEGHLRRYRVSLNEFNDWKQGRSDAGDRPGPQ